MAEPTVLHSYGLIDPPDLQLRLPAGVDDRPVSAVGVGPFTVLVSTLSQERFGADQWAKHAEDVDWIKRVASEHHRVLQQTVEQTDVLPLGLSTIHRDEDDLRRGVLDREEGLRAGLERVRGQVELGVKVYAALPEVPAPAVKPTSGREYLNRRSAERRDSETLWSELQTEALRIHTELALGATHSRSNPAQDPLLSGRDEPMLLNGAYLVPRSAEAAFRARAAELAREGLSVECTGPWPAYSFADGASLVGAAS